MAALFMLKYKCPAGIKDTNVFNYSNHLRMSRPGELIVMGYKRNFHWKINFVGVFY